MDVIGAGFGRTGTASLKAALEQLGFGPCYHMFEVFRRPERITDWQRALDGEDVDWDRVFAGYRATVDWPGAAYWRRLHEHYPDAKVILSTRDPHQWWRSVYDTIYAAATSHSTTADLDGEAAEQFESMLRPTLQQLIWDGTFDGRFADEQHAIEVFEQHNAEVRATVPPEQLLEYSPGDGWEPLCDFLGVPVPDEPYPRVNGTGSVSENARQALQEALA